MRGGPRGHISLVLSEGVQDGPGRCVGAGRPAENRISRRGYLGRVQGMGGAETFRAINKDIETLGPALELYEETP